MRERPTVDNAAGSLLFRFSTFSGHGERDTGSAEFSHHTRSWQACDERAATFDTDFKCAPSKDLDTRNVVHKHVLGQYEFAFAINAFEFQSERTPLGERSDPSNPMPKGAEAVHLPIKPQLR